MTPEDMFASIEEGREERAAIMAEAGNSEPDAKASDDLHRCEVAAVIRQCYPDREKAQAYFALVESKRGKEAAQRLRDDTRAAWMERQKTERQAHG